jgi:hypothetical protein
VNIIPVPGLLTDQEHPPRADGTAAADLRALILKGYEWISFQLVNGTTVNAIDIAKYGKASGFKSTGAWGVVYDQADFLAFGKRFGAACVAQQAEHAIVDAEMCAKGTRDGQKMKPIIDGMKAAGWAGPVHLCPLGAPVNARPHGTNDFAVDVKSYLDTDGGLLPQAYFNAYDEYRPDLCVDYWVACGVPADRINVMVELAVEGAKNVKITGAQWVPLLQTAGVKRNFSVYMVQHGTDQDWAGLEQLSKPAAPAPTPIPTPAPAPSATELRAKIVELADQWLKTRPGPETLSRLRVIRRIADTGNTDPRWTAEREAIVDALDKAGVP